MDESNQTVSEYLEKLIADSKRFKSSSCTISGDTHGGWGFRISVCSPEEWKRIRDADVWEDEDPCDGCDGCDDDDEADPLEGIDVRDFNWKPVNGDKGNG